MLGFHFSSHHEIVALPRFPHIRNKVAQTTSQTVPARFFRSHKAWVVTAASAMAASRSLLGLTALIFISGALVLLFFVVLSGLNSTTPLNQTWFLRADTSGITGARPITQWTYFYMCGDGNTDCGPAWPAPPFGWAWSGNPANAPAELIGGQGSSTTSDYYFYMWRFGWVFYLIALAFAGFTFLAGWLACLGRLGNGLLGLLSMLAFVFMTVAASLMTATFVKARNAFLASGRDASIGQYAFGFTWGAWAALLIATVLFFLNLRSSSSDHVTTRRRWGRQRSTRSRRSYDMGSRRVKDDYS